MGLSEQKVRSFLTASEGLLESDIGLQNYAERAYRFIDQLISNEFIAFGTLHLEEGNLEIGSSRNISNFAEAMEGLGRVMSDYELYNWDPEVNGGRPFTRGDFFSARQFRETSVYSATMKPLGVDNHCAVHVPGVDGEISFFGIERNGGPDFSSEERILLEMSQSLLGSARNLALARNRSLGNEANPAALVRAGMTSREAEVLTLLAEGFSNQRMSETLSISVDTIKEHMGRILAKSGTPNRLAAALWALRVSRIDATRSTVDHLPKVVVSVRNPPLS